MPMQALVSHTTAMTLLQSTDNERFSYWTPKCLLACLPAVTNLSDYKELGGSGDYPGTQLVSGHDPFWPDVPDAAHSRSDPCWVRGPERLAESMAWTQD